MSRMSALKQHISAWKRRRRIMITQGIAQQGMDRLIACSVVAEDAWSCAPDHVLQKSEL
jgi:hypothetical protein